MTDHKKDKTVIIICGPTAVGKTSFAIKLAYQFQTQIISADSRQCFKELNIGVAKPSNEDLQAIHHYFINSHSIFEDVNAVVFEQYALDAANKIFQDHEVAIMVGGTGLYIKAFTHGMDEIPAIVESIRLQVIKGFKENGIAYLQNELAEKDPHYHQHSEQQNPQRLMRALEVLLSTGRPIITYQKGKEVERPFNIVKIGLELPRQELYDRINNRVDGMVQDGLVDEVTNLLPHQHLNALQTVGYRELFDYLNRQLTLEQAITNIKTNSRHYAKRQLTWFKKDENVKWFSADGRDAFEFIKNH